MPVFETFTKRLKIRERAGKPDVYAYDNLPQAFRIQVIHIWASAIGRYFFVERWETTPASNRHWHTIHDMLARERGVFNLGDERDNPFAQCQKFLQASDTAGALDIIELSFRVLDRVVRQQGYDDTQTSGVTQDPDDAIEELNYRFREHGIGYQFVGGELIRVDSQYLHAEAVMPALSLLNDEGFDGPAEEFLRAHDHYRKGRNKEAIVEALKAFESTMKCICEQRKWLYSPTASAKPLVEIMFRNALVPPYLESQFGALRALLESGIPTVRDKTSGHGQGATPTTVPSYLTAYALHLTASNIVFLIGAHRSRS